MSPLRPPPRNPSNPGRVQPSPASQAATAHVSRSAVPRKGLCFSDVRFWAVSSLSRLRSHLPIVRFCSCSRSTCSHMPITRSKPVQTGKKKHNDDRIGLVVLKFGVGFATNYKLCTTYDTTRFAKIKLCCSSPASVPGRDSHHRLHQICSKWSFH